MNVEYALQQITRYLTIYVVPILKCTIKNESWILLDQFLNNFFISFTDWQMTECLLSTNI